jgi:hypothetical protein
MIINSSNSASCPIHVRSHSCISILKGSESLLQRYAYFKFIHFLFNLAAIAFLLAEIVKFNTNGYDVYQCDIFGGVGLECQFDTNNGTLKFTVVYFVVGLMILLVELCECFLLRFFWGYDR